MRKKARVLVTIKPDVLDPSGMAVKKVLHRQGIYAVEEVRVGKVIDIVFSYVDDDVDQRIVTEHLKNILCNSVIEDFAIQTMDEL